MSLPNNINSSSIENIKKTMNGALDNIKVLYDKEDEKMGIADKMNEMYNKALNNGEKIQSVQLFTKQVLSNTLADQLDEIDTKNRMIQYTENDLLFNQNLVKTLYILLIIISIGAVIGIVLYFTGFLNSEKTVTSVSEPGSSGYFSNLFGSNTNDISSSSSTSNGYFSNLIGSNTNEGIRYGGKKK